MTVVAGLRGDVRHRRGISPPDIVDIFVYVVILNLAIEYLPRVLTESFTLSLFTALLLKAVLEVVVLLKKAVIGRIRNASTTAARLLAVVLLWLVLVGSKIAVLELVDVIFGDRVSLGGFLSVTLLIVVLVLSRELVRRMLETPPPKS